MKNCNVACFAQKTFFWKLAATCVLLVPYLMTREALDMGRFSSILVQVFVLVDNLDFLGQ